MLLVNKPISQSHRRFVVKGQRHAQGHQLGRRCGTGERSKIRKIGRHRQEPPQSSRGGVELSLVEKHRRLKS